MLDGPKYKLDEVRKLVLRYRAGEDTLWFSAPSRSIDYTVRVLVCDAQRAEEVILAGLEILTLEDFVSRTLQWNVVCDIYGLEGHEGHNWYVKFALSHDETPPLVEEISFHPLEQDLRVADGRLLKVTFVPER